MKVTKISATLLREVKTHRQDLQATLEKFGGKNKVLAKLHRRSDEIRAELARLEDADHSDKDAITAIGNLRIELSLVESNAAKNSAAGTPAGEALRQALQQAAQIIRRALQPTVQAYENQIADALRPFYRASLFGDGTYAARATDAARAFCAFVGSQIGSDASASDALWALRVMDGIIAGEISWQFDPTT